MSLSVHLRSAAPGNFPQLILESVNQDGEEGGTSSTSRHHDNSRGWRKDGGERSGRWEHAELRQVLLKGLRIAREIVLAGWELREHLLNRTTVSHVFCNFAFSNTELN